VNWLGWLIVSGAAHATAFAIIGCIAYLAIRRVSPAAGSLAAAASLVIMAAVSLIALVPLPAWWVLTIGPTTRQAAVISLSTPSDLQAKHHRGRAGLPSEPVDLAEPQMLSPVPGDETLPISAWVSGFVTELRQPAGDFEQSRRPWPAWIVLGFVGSVGLGLARLALGLWSIRRLRANSMTVEDRDLIDAVEVLRAELSCPRPVEIRVTPELTTPATIGWRRPIVLLPGNWRDWNAPERRAALSHELAHICRSDFLTGLTAQISLTLHFYNPLAHWLARRLHLEQELAADAWGAHLSGGKQSYLTTLAHMALRRDSHTLSWPARAFLPSRGTFVRRIEMLRNTKRIRHAPLPTVTRLLTIGLLSIAGLLIAGLRGPAGVSTAQAQAQLPAGGSAKTLVNDSYNLAFVPADARMVLAVRPQVLLERREARSLLESIKQIPAFKGALAIPPEDVDQLLVFWDGNPQAPDEPYRNPMVPFPAGGVVRTSKSQEWKSLYRNPNLGPMREVRHDGQAYLSFVGANNTPGWGAFTPDDRTLVVARVDLLRELIEDRKSPVPPHPWDEAWNKAAKGQVMLAFETRWLRRRLAQVPPGQTQNANLTLETISPLLEKSQSYALGIELSQGLTVDLVAVTRGESDAEPVANTLRALVTLGKNAVMGMRQSLHGQQSESEASSSIFDAAGSLMERARVETSGRFVNLRAKSSLDLSACVKLLAPAVAAANTAARRKLSVNNLKQIGLAFHNYHSANGQFPTPVLYGGATGKVPHSWRVAILPYLEHDPLYKQYNFDEPWDGPGNRKLLDKMPAVLGYPGLDGSPASGTNTAYFVFTGKGTALSPSSGAAPAGRTGNVPRPITTTPPLGSGPLGPTLIDITDGTSNTILAVEAKRDIPWTKPEDFPFDPNAVLPELGGYNGNGFNAVFADGAVRFISKTVDTTVLKGLITRDGGEVIRRDEPSQPTTPRATR
jgi:beta-lactamase regulating signal transducer with metallopeptidase domain